jgi:hypothetical protein
MARPADVLALAAKAYAETAKARAVAAEAQAVLANADALRRKNEKPLAELQEFFAERSGQFEAAAKVVGAKKFAELAAEVDRAARMLEASRAETAKAVDGIRVAACRGRRTRAGVRPRASRGRPVRLRGSRRTTTATRAGPSSSDPALGDEPPGHRPSRTGAAI